MSRNRLRVGLAGAGWIAPYHLFGFAANNDADIVGLTSHSGLSDNEAT